MRKRMRPFDKQLREYRALLATLHLRHEFTQTVDINGQVNVSATIYLNCADIDMILVQHPEITPSPELNQTDWFDMLQTLGQMLHQYRPEIWYQYQVLYLVKNLAQSLIEFGVDDTSVALSVDDFDMGTIKQVVVSLGTEIQSKINTKWAHQLSIPMAWEILVGVLDLAIGVVLDAKLREIPGEMSD